MFIVCTSVLAAEITICEEITTMLLLVSIPIHYTAVISIPIDHIHKEVCVVGRFSHYFVSCTTCWTIVVIVTVC